MAIKGSVAKEEITKKLLETFANSFVYDKEIRIPWEENGEQLQIKCTLTCAKVAVCAPNGTTTSAPQEAEIVGQTGEITKEEKGKVLDLIKKLDL